MSSSDGRILRVLGVRAVQNSEHTRSTNVRIRYRGYFFSRSVLLLYSPVLGASSSDNLCTPQYHSSGKICGSQLTTRQPLYNRLVGRNSYYLRAVCDTSTARVAYVLRVFIKDTRHLSVHHIRYHCSRNKHATTGPRWPNTCM